MMYAFMTAAFGAGFALAAGLWDSRGELNAAYFCIGSLLFIVSLTVALTIAVAR